MEATLMRNFKQGFLLDEKELRRLYDLMLEQVTGNEQGIKVITRFKARLRNGVSLEVPSIDDLLAHENGGASAIQQLEMRVRTPYTNATERGIDLTFTDWNARPYEQGAIRYYIEGDSRDWVFVTSSKLEERFERIRAFSVGAFVSSNLGCAILVLAIILTFALFIVPVLPDASQVPTWARLGMQLLGTLLTVAIFTGDRVVSWLYPPYVFLWGDHVREYERRRRKANFWLVGIGLAVAVNLLAALIWRVVAGD